MRQSVRALLRVILPLCAIAAMGAQGTRFPVTVDVDGGKVVGVAGRHVDVTVFKGIPFAAPPVGAGRWKAPGAVIPWSGLRKADTFSPSCIQTIVTEKKPWTYEFMAHGEVSEDCLYLNVWTPARAATERRPVFVYVYGGANVEGSGSIPAYDGEGLAGKGLVVVTFNYRVGVLGFYAHPDLTKEAAYHASGNYGLLDQIAAVRWVQKNIAAFGGDPSRVTIAGQSAGAQGVHNMVSSPLAKGLFQRAIAQSGSTLAATATGRPLADQEADGVRFAQAKGAATIADLRAMTWQQVVAPATYAPTPTAAGGGRGAAAPRFGIVLDGYALPATAGQLFTEGKQNDVPTLTGSNADENGAVPHPTITLDAFKTQAQQRYGDLAPEFLRLYPATSDAEARAASNDSARDQARTSTYLWALLRATSAKTPAFTYFYTHPLPGPDVDQYGAFHTSEVPYALNTLEMSDRPFVDADRKVAAVMSSYWANFATTGDPNGRGLPVWPAATATSPQAMSIGQTTAAIPVAGSPAKLAFWKKFLQR